MKLAEFIERLNKMYEECGDVDVCVDIDIEALAVDHFGNVLYADDSLQNIGDSLFTENIEDIGYTKDIKGEINGIYITNYTIPEEDE